LCVPFFLPVSTIHHVATLKGFQGVVVSGSSTATSLNDERNYPNLARYAATESVVAQGLVAVIRQYKWNRIAVIHDDTLWGRDSANAVITEFKKAVTDAEVLIEGTALAFRHRD
jgi:ABC-type branched-subunit amino acid transport system substrate-binding protein